MNDRITVPNDATTYTEYLTQRCLDELAEYRAVRDQADAVRAALKESMSPALWKEVQQLVDAETAAAYHWADVCVAELGRHFPGVAPALRIVWKEHIISLKLDDAGRCCLTQDPA